MVAENRSIKGKSRQKMPTRNKHIPILWKYLAKKATRMYPDSKIIRLHLNIAVIWTRHRYFRGQPRTRRESKECFIRQIYNRAKLDSHLCSSLSNTISIKRLAHQKITDLMFFRVGLEEPMCQTWWAQITAKIRDLVWYFLTSKSVKSWHTQNRELLFRLLVKLAREDNLVFWWAEMGATWATLNGIVKSK